MPVCIWGGGSKAFWTMLKKTALFWKDGFPYSAYYYSGAFILEICWTSKYLLLSWAYFCTYLAMFWYFFLPFKIPLNPVSTTEIYLPPRYLSPFSFLPLKMLLSPWSPWFDWWASHPENTSRVFINMLAMIELGMVI